MGTKYSVKDRAISFRQWRAKRMRKMLKSICPGESHSAMARRIKVSRQTLYDWQSGKSWPNKIKAKRLARIAGISYRELRP